jgi:hypothetical protein
MFSLLAQIGRQPAAPLQLWLRTAGLKIRPAAPPHPHRVKVRRRQDALLAAGLAGPHQCATLQVESRPGPLATIVIGGFVPDSTEALYLLRSNLLQQGSVYYFNYPRRGFSTDMFLAQLSDLVEEVSEGFARPPVILGISFGAGLVMEWLRRFVRPESPPALAGLVLVSPVGCAADLLDPTQAKPTTLLGRVIKPYIDSAGRADGAIVERSRAVFLKMFESGAQNKEALRLLLSREELGRLRDAVLASINAIEPAAARDRVQALCNFNPFQVVRPLCGAPALVLFAEKESAVLCASAPTERELRSRMTLWFPQGQCLTVCNSADNPVQHASLIFHARNFRPILAGFYRSLRQKQRQRRAA